MAAPLRHPMKASLPAAPLLQMIDLRGGTRACGIGPRSAAKRAVERARRTGLLTPRAADQLAVHHLGLTPTEIWGF